MPRYLGTPEYRHDLPPKTGVLLVNLGTPDEPTPKALRAYLREFLSDPRVVEMPRALWWPLLHGVILNIRPRRSAHAYRKIWTEAGSPLLVHSREQAERIGEQLRERYGDRVVVALAMRYGQPSIANALQELREEGIWRLLVLPLYPQYSATSTGSVFDAVSRELQCWRWVPELRTVASYHDDPDYIQALADHIRAFWQREGGHGVRLLFSYHGIPRRYFLAGDPYHCQCHKTSRLLAEALDLEEGSWQTTFQSRFGRERWLEPYTDKTLRQLAREGVKHVDVVCPGFAADCLETLEEIAMQNRKVFLKAGGEQFRYIPALNASDAHIDTLVGLIEWHAQGWPEFAEDEDPAQAKAEARERQARAQALGAEW